MKWEVDGRWADGACRVLQALSVAENAAPIYHPTLAALTAAMLSIQLMDEPNSFWTLLWTSRDVLEGSYFTPL